MEDLMIKVLFVIEHNLNKKLQRVEDLIKKNNKNFSILLNEKDALQGRIMNQYCLQNSNKSLSDQIGFMFKIIERDVQTKSLLNFEISKVSGSSGFSLEVRMKTY
jgi:hypothetical protein